VTSTLIDLLAPLVGERASVAFAALLVCHVPAGVVCVVAGAVATLSPKRRGRHPRFGTIYYSALVVVFVTASAMAFLRWSEDAYLFVLGTISFGSGSAGYLARRVQWRGWLTCHILGMGLSYVVLMTAFYVDNGPRLPLWNQLPVVAFWTVPSLIGLPLIARALVRYGNRGGPGERLRPTPREAETQGPITRNQGGVGRSLARIHAPRPSTTRQTARRAESSDGLDRG
jgi:hypothetical protein